MQVRAVRFGTVRARADPSMTIPRRNPLRALQSRTCLSVRPANVSALTRKRQSEGTEGPPSDGDCRVQRLVSWPEGKAPSDSSLSGGTSGSRRARAADLFHGSRGSPSGPASLAGRSRGLQATAARCSAEARDPRPEEIGLGGAVQVRSGSARKCHEKPRVLKRPAARLISEAQQLDH